MTLLKSRERKGTKGFKEIKMKPKTVEVALLRSSKAAWLCSMDPRKPEQVFHVTCFLKLKFV